MSTMGWLHQGPLGEAASRMKRSTLTLHLQESTLLHALSIYIWSIHSCSHTWPSLSLGVHLFGLASVLGNI